MYISTEKNVKEQEKCEKENENEIKLCCLMRLQRAYVKESPEQITPTHVCMFAYVILLLSCTICALVKIFNKLFIRFNLKNFQAFKIASKNVIYVSFATSSKKIVSDWN